MRVLVLRFPYFTDNSIVDLLHVFADPTHDMCIETSSVFNIEEHLHILYQILNAETLLI
jgi:hypothetical protein